ncbi:hypothetical protein ACFY1U_06630 [Streptomyces sp. NPDC001351]|uniref:hypothetical protein n=1 Tax=Streptomyces sp. NPDC001351 TaxID=3364564 RepID=UPI0036C91F96
MAEVLLHLQAQDEARRARVAEATKAGRDVADEDHPPGAMPRLPVESCAHAEGRPPQKVTAPQWT